jgi:3-phenylpropionate/cinnamic acid dioxygenase small subunit
VAFDLRAAEAFLFHEARLLDDGKLDEWLALFAEECLYSLPILDDDESGLEPTIIHDDRARLEERIFRLNETRAYAQEPPSRTQHNISNVELVENTPSGATVRCNLTLFEVRIGDTSQLDLGRPQVLAGRCEYTLVTNPRTLIRRKRVVLLTRDLPLQNLSFVI